MAVGACAGTQRRAALSFTCPRCGRASHQSEDERWGWCAHCNAFTGRSDEPQGCVQVCAHVHTLLDDAGVDYKMRVPATDGTTGTPTLAEMTDHAKVIAALRTHRLVPK